MSYSYTPPANSATKKVCVYAQDAAGNSDSSLWGTAIAQPLPEGGERQTQTTSLVTCESTTTGPRCWVPHDWPLIPTASAQGDSFRLLFVTSDMNATSSLVGPYNAKAQSDANTNVNLRPMKDHFRALVQPWNSAHHMKPNSRTRSTDLGAGDPIYWLDGPKVADDYADFYDGSWDSSSGTIASTITGTVANAGGWSVWTGSKNDGTALSGQQVGDSWVAFGKPVSSGLELGPASGTASRRPQSETRGVYALSPVITVAALWSLRGAPSGPPR